MVYLTSEATQAKTQGNRRLHPTGTPPNLKNASNPLPEFAAPHGIADLRKTSPAHRPSRFPGRWPKTLCLMPWLNSQPISSPPKKDEAKQTELSIRLPGSLLTLCPETFAPAAQLEKLIKSPRLGTRKKIITQNLDASPRITDARVDVDSVQSVKTPVLNAFVCSLRAAP